jgi:Uncharacterized protein conserved in bacteria (DUF2184)
MNLKEKFMFDQGFKQEQKELHQDTVSMLTDANIVNYGDVPLLGSNKKAYGVNIIDGFKNVSNDLMIFKDTNAANQFTKMAMDDTVQFAAPSNGTIPYFTTIWTNKLIKQLLQVTASRKLTHEFQQGQWATTNIKLPTLAYLGQSAPYADFGGAGNTSVNTNWVDRETVRLQRTITYGDLAVAQMSMGKIDYVAALREALANLVALDQDEINFFGYSGINVFGMLNDPNLNATIPAPASAANPSSGQWIYKTFTEIIFDINTMVNAIVARAGGNADSYNDKFYLALPPAVVTYLNDPNSFGVNSVKAYIQNTYPNMEIVQAQFLQGSGSPIGASNPNYALMIWEKLGGQECVLNAFSSLWNSHGVVREISYFNEKISYTVSGSIVTMPAGVQIMSGI